jgi:hypothetical protein
MATVSSNEELNIYAKFLGYGKESAKYLFFGINERLTDNSDNGDRFKLYEAKYYKEKKQLYTLDCSDFIEFYRGHKKIEESDRSEIDKSTSIYTTYRNIYHSLEHQGEEVVKCNWDLWNHNVLIGNLLPFASKGTGSSSGNREDQWLGNARNVQVREQEVVGFLSGKAKDGKYIFCFGKMKEYRRLFAESGIDFEPDCQFSRTAKNGARTYYQAKQRHIYLLNHTSYGWLRKEQVGELCDRILGKSNR